MNIDFLLSFKNLPEVLNLDSSFIDLLPDNFFNMHSKKVKKKIEKPVLKANLLKNTKLQTAKNKDENKVNLILNKLSNTNIDNIIKEFLETFTEINQEKYNIILKTIYLKIIKDSKFVDIYFKFYNMINSIYTTIFNVNNKYFIDMIEKKTLYDYEENILEENILEENILKENILKENILEENILKENILEENILEENILEENRINNLKIIILLIESNQFDSNIILVITSIILKSNKIPDIIFWFSNPTINLTIKLKTYYDILVNKLNSTINNRSYVLLKNLLNIQDNTKETKKDNIILSDISYNNIIVNIKENKSEFEIEINNIIEEFLFLEDMDEIINFIKKFKDNEKSIRFFIKTLLNIYFNNTLNNYLKFKNLFINLKNSKLIKNTIFTISLNEIITNENKLDYNNFDKKLEKLNKLFK